MTMVETRRTANRGPVTGKVPAEAGAAFLAARLPAIARIGMTTKNRPSSVATPIVLLNQGVLALMPPKADPLLPTAEV